MNASVPTFQESRPAPPRWKFFYLASAWFAGILLQPGCLHCLCSIGDWRMGVAAWFDVLILLRMAAAYIRREIGYAWALYAMLCLTSFLWLRLLTDGILHVTERWDC